jgi:hypothetical protein
MELDWCAPEACSLPLADQPARVAEWDALFTDAVCGVSPIEGGVRLVVDRAVTTPAEVADLADRESQCCSFLGFTVAVGDGTLTLDVMADADRADVVAALAGRARSLSGTP